jgi:hypothetical protein
VLELEPSEAEDLPVPDPEMVPDALIEQVDQLVRNGEIEAALDLVDKTVLIDKIGLDESAVAASRKAWEKLRNRRTGRKGRRKTAVPVTIVEAV